MQGRSEIPFVIGTHMPVLCLQLYVEEHCCPFVLASSGGGGEGPRAMIRYCTIRTMCRFCYKVE